MAAARAALPILTSVSSISVCPSNGMAASVSLLLLLLVFCCCYYCCFVVILFVTRVETLINAIAHMSCTNTVRESTLKVDFEEKTFLAAPGNQT